MDKKLEDALAFANYRLTLQIQRQNIIAQIEAALLVSYQGAIFKSTQELIAFVGIKTIRNEKVFVEDHSGNVMLIDDANEFLNVLIQTHDYAMETKQVEQKKLKSARSTAKIVGL